MKTLHGFITREAASTGQLKPEYKITEPMRYALKSFSEDDYAKCPNWGVRSNTLLALEKRGFIETKDQKGFKWATELAWKRTLAGSMALRGEHTQEGSNGQ